MPCIPVFLYSCIPQNTKHFFIVSLYTHSITVSLFHIVSLYNCITLSLHHFNTTSLYHCATVLLYHCTTVLLYHSTTTSLYHCTTIPLHNCTTVPLYPCPAVSTSCPVNNEPASHISPLSLSVQIALIASLNCTHCTALHCTAQQYIPQQYFPIVWNKGTKYHKHSALAVFTAHTCTGLDWTIQCKRVQHSAAQCSTVQHSAAECSTVQCSARFGCLGLTGVSAGLRSSAGTGVLHCTTRTGRHCTALHCTALHCTALHCNELLHCNGMQCTAQHYCALL